jgi:hypothetical protein
MMEGKFLDEKSIENNRREAEARRKKAMEEERADAGKRMSCWAGLVLIGGGLVAMILQGLIDTTIGVTVLAIACAALGRGTK